MQLPMNIVNALFTSGTDYLGKQHEANIKALNEIEWERYKDIQDVIDVVTLFASRSR